MTTKAVLEQRLRESQEECEQLRKRLRGECSLMQTAEMLLDIAAPLLKAASACIGVAEANAKDTP